MPTSTAQLIIFNNNDLAKAAGIQFKVDNFYQAQGDINYVSDVDGNVTGRFAFRLREGNNDWSERLSISSGGNVGIGTGNKVPTATLTVVGEINVTGVSDAGVSRVVCVKADGNFGFCSSDISVFGTCTCG